MGPVNLSFGGNRLSSIQIDGTSDEDEDDDNGSEDDENEDEIKQRQRMEKKKKRAEARKNKMVRSQKERGDKKLNDPTLMKMKNEMKTAKNENESTASDMSHVFDGLDTIGKALIDNVQHELQRKDTANLLFSGSSKMSQSGSSQHRTIHRPDNLFSG